MTRKFGIGAACVGLFLGGSVWAAGENVALHRKATVSPPSNYEFTKNRNPNQLTDGIYASTHAKWDEKHQSSSLWVQEGTLGWAHKKPVIVTIDLGSVQPISGVIYSTAGGRAGVSWPEAIYIATSDDGKAWHYAGDLVALSKKAGRQPPKEGYANFRYIARDLKTHGRYVSLGVDEPAMVFVDEVEVLRGDEALLQAPAGREIPAMEEFFAQATITSKAKNRLNADIDSVRGLLNKGGLPPEQVKGWEGRLQKDAQATAEMEPLPPDFKTIIPLTDVHRDILAVHGEALAARGFKPLTVWKVHRYAWRPLVETPQEGHAAAIDLSMLKDQIRSDSILLTNATGRPMTVGVRLKDAPQGAEAGWVRLESAIWTDTQANEPVQDALMPMEPKAGAYSMTIPAGVTGKLWVTVDTSKMNPGDYKSALEITGGQQRIDAPLSLHVSKVAMERPRMSLYVWDYTNRDKMYGLTKENRQAAIEMMRSHYVDSPWAVYALPTPKARDFDSSDQLTGKLDFSNLDEWVKMWPGARNYMVFYNVYKRMDFAGAKVGTDAFKARLASWTKAVAAHWRSLGMKPSQLVLCLVDEPRSNDYDQCLVEWGSVVKAAAPEVRIFSDPIWRDPSKSKYPQAFLIPDILCPHAGWATEFYEKLRDEHGRKIWFYNGPGLHHTGDPQLAYRQMAWRVFAIGGMGEGFWAFGDTSGAPTSWNAYTAAKPIYAPAYLGKTSVNDGIHWVAAREGVEDFEELSMLKDAIGRCEDATLKAAAQKVLAEAVKAVNGNAGDNTDFKWSAGTDPFVVDAQLGKVREILERMR